MNPRLIRLVASHYREMQGLSTIADAILLGSFYVLAFVGSNLWLAVFAVWVGGFLLLRFRAIARHIDAYYATRCGRVAGRPPRSAFQWAIYGVVFPPALYDMHVARDGIVLFVVALLAVPAAWIVIRDWPYRAYWLVPCSIGIIWALKLASITTRHDVAVWQTHVSIAYAAALAVAGLLDHALLLSVLKPHNPEEFRLKAEATGSGAVVPKP